MAKVVSVQALLIPPAHTSLVVLQATIGMVLSVFQATTLALAGQIQLPGLAAIVSLPQAAVVPVHTGIMAPVLVEALAVTAEAVDQQQAVVHQLQVPVHQARIG